MLSFKKKKMKLAKSSQHGILCRVMYSAHQLSEKFKIEQHTFLPSFKQDVA